MYLGDISNMVNMKMEQGRGAVTGYTKAYIDAACVTTLSHIFTQSVQANENQWYFKFSDHFVIIGMILSILSPVTGGTAKHRLKNTHTFSALVRANPLKPPDDIPHYLKRIYCTLFLIPAINNWGIIKLWDAKLICTYWRGGRVFMDNFFDAEKLYFDKNK